MKKCPKCGTILDDSKKQCYMCGASLEEKKSTSNDFSNPFDATIGATVSKGQDNVFNNGEDITIKPKEVVKKNNDNVFFSQNSSSQDFFGGEINKLNSMSYDERSSIKKGIDNLFNSKSKFKSKNSTNKEKKNEKVNNKITYSTMPKKDENQSKPIPHNNPPQPKPEKPKPTPKTNQFFNDDIQDSKTPPPPKKVFDFENKNQKPNNMNPLVPKPNINRKSQRQTKIKEMQFTGDTKRMAVNFVCILLFIGMLVFVYFAFLKKDKSTDLAGLVYQINDEFKLSSQDSMSRYYKYNDKCTVRVNYGATNSADNFIDNYLKNIEETYIKDKDATASYDELKINDNVWTTLSIVYLKKETSGIGGAAPLARYRYTTIINKGNFYSIIFTNMDEDQACEQKYEEFANTLNFNKSD